jgi:hypothetical protein
VCAPPLLQSPWSQFRTLVQVRQLPMLVMLLVMCVTREFLGGEKI